MISSRQENTSMPTIGVKEVIGAAFLEYLGRKRAGKKLALKGPGPCLVGPPAGKTSSAEPSSRHQSHGVAACVTSRDPRLPSYLYRPCCRRSTEDEQGHAQPAVPPEFPDKMRQRITGIPAWRVSEVLAPGSRNHNFNDQPLVSIASSVRRDVLVPRTDEHPGALPD